jgi:hypothetical protein
VAADPEHDRKVYSKRPQTDAELGAGLAVTSVDIRIGAVEATAHNLVESVVIAQFGRPPPAEEFFEAQFAEADAGRPRGARRLSSSSG